MSRGLGDVYKRQGHYAMLGYVYVDEENEYNEWLSEQMTFEEILASNGKSDLIKLALNKKNDL